MKRLVLLNPGPVNVTDKVRDAMLRGDMCHREHEMTELLQSIREKIVTAFQIEDDYSAVLISGSGTSALEMGVSSCLSDGKSILVIRNGIYGERIAKMADAYKLSKFIVDTPWGTPPDLGEIENVLKSKPEIEVVAMVHHETTTGLLNPLNEVGTLAKKYGKKLLVDAISSLAGDPVDFNNSQIDFGIGTANKCIQGLPGVSFVLVRNTEWNRLEKITSRSIYFDLFKNYKSQEKGIPLFTPAVQMHYSFEAALEELLQETVEARIKRYANVASFLRKGFQDLDLEFFVPESLLSNVLTSLKLPKDINYEELHDGLRQRGFVIYAGQGGLSEQIFRVANIGDIQKEEFQNFLEALKDCLASKKLVNP